MSDTIADTPTGFDASGASPPAEIPSIVLEAWRRFRHVVPCPDNQKFPDFAWRHYATVPPSEEQLHEWAQTYNSFAIICGPESGVFGADFDGLDGACWAEAHELEFHTLTPRGGGHLLIEWPAGQQINNHVRLEGLPIDLRGANGLLVFFGSNRQQKRGFDDLAKLEELPSELRRLIQNGHSHKKETPLGDESPYSAEDRLQFTIKKATPGNRNDLGFEFCCQLRDSGLPLREARPYMQRYQQAAKADGLGSRVGLFRDC